MRDYPIWVLVADGCRARVLVRTCPGAAWREHLERFRREGAERPRLVSGPVGPEQEAGARAEAAFAARLAQGLELGARGGQYQRLILVAPSRFLTHLHLVIGEAAREKLCGSLDRDLTRWPAPEIVSEIEKERAAYGLRQEPLRGRPCREP